MEVLVGVVLTFGAGLGVTVAALVAGRRSLAAMWLEAGRAAGLSRLQVRTRAGWPMCVEGSRGPLTVRIRSLYIREVAETATLLEVRGVTSRIALIPVTLASRVARERDVRIGDAAFDEAIVVTGDEAVAAAVLDGRTRELIRELFAPRIVTEFPRVEADRGRLDPGCLVVERMLGNQAVWLASYLEGVLTLAVRLREPSDLASRLLANVQEDTDASVRLTNLRLLLREPDSQARRTALQNAVGDVDEDVRLEAAIELGASGRPALLRIATDARAGDTCAARAIETLRSAFPADQAGTVLAQALGNRRLRTAAACIESLGRRGPDQAEAIGRVLAVEHGELARVAARALGRVGAAPAIVLLHEAVERLPRDRALREAATEATVAIRARLVGAGEGQVSLAGDEPGRVSLARDEAGRVSVPTGDAE